MTSHLRLLSRALWPLCVALVYFVFAYAGLKSNPEEGLAIFWPASGIFVAALLMTDVRQKGALYGSVAISCWLAHFVVFDSWYLSVGYTLASLIEVYIVARLITKGDGTRRSFTDPRYVLRFTAACLCGAAAGAALACVVARDFSVSFFLAWFITAALGMLIVVPLAVTFWRAFVSKKTQFDFSQLLGGTIAIWLVVAFSAFVFWQDSYPMLFLPPVAVIFATYFLGPLGASVSVFLVAIIASIMTANGYGPVEMTQVSILILQFYLFTQLASALPLAALLTMRDFDFAQIERGNRLLATAERMAHVGHWQIDLKTDQLAWSDEVYRIHGIEKGEALTLTKAVDAIHPIDRSVVEAALTKVIETSEPFDFEARVVRPDGDVVHIHSRGEAQLNAKGQTVAIFGMIQDVTERVQATLEVQMARRQAEAEALRAEKLAETDQLTGIANRRKAMATFEQEIGRAQRHENALSVAMLDIDHFKSINDNFGHATGDVVLQKVAITCRKALRDSDFVGRIGGEEFILIFPHTDVEGAMIVAERVRADVERIDWGPLELESVTVSIGLSTYSEGSDAASILHAADRALYEAKRNGRNRLLNAA